MEQVPQYGWTTMPTPAARPPASCVLCSFAGVENFADGTSPGFEVRMTTPFGDAALRGGPRSPVTVQMLP
jgi:hypothetical protein